MKVAMVRGVRSERTYTMPRASRPKKTSVRGIRKDGDRYLVRARWNDPKTGERRKREGTANTFAEAVALKDQLKHEPARETPSRQRLEDYAMQWSEEHASRAAPSTRLYWATSLAHATTAMGRIYVNALTPADIRKWRNASAKKVAHATVNGWLRVLRVCLDDAVQDGILNTNPARAIKTLREGPTKGARARSLTLEEFRRFISTTQQLAGVTISEDIARMILTLAWTGLRLGEVRALRWTDLHDDELTIERAVWNGQEKTTKTGEPRKVAVVAPLAHVLNEQRQWLLREQHPGLESDLIFPATPRSAKGSATRRNAKLRWYRSASTTAKPLKKIIDVADIPQISAHSLRRTWENLMRRAGVDQLVRRSLAGWRTEEAQAIYATVNREEREAAVAAVVDMVMEDQRQDADAPAKDEKRYAQRYAPPKSAKTPDQQQVPTGRHQRVFSERDTRFELATFSLGTSNNNTKSLTNN